MNQREIILSAVVLIGLTFTTFSFTEEDCFECNQSLFSDMSSCSLIGGSCISTHEQAGFNGLWNHFTTLELTKDDDGYTLSCSPDCFIKLKTEQAAPKTDTVFRALPSVLQ